MITCIKDDIQKWNADSAKSVARLLLTSTGAGFCFGFCTWKCRVRIMLCCCYSWGNLINIKLFFYVELTCILCLLLVTIMFVSCSSQLSCRLSLWILIYTGLMPLETNLSTEPWEWDVGVAGSVHCWHWHTWRFFFVVQTTPVSKAFLDFSS